MNRMAAILPATLGLLAGALVLAAPPGASAAPALDRSLSLAAHGGVTVQVPAWEVLREADAAAVLEQAPDPAQRRPFYVLLVAVEEGPGDEAVPWEAIRDNIVEAAGRKGRSLELAIEAPFDRARGFAGRIMRGTFRGEGERRVAVQLATLVRDGRMVTVSVVSESPTDAARAILEAVAATVALTP